MNKAIFILLVFSFSFCFAQLIDHESDDHMGPMYQYLQSNPVYYTEQDVRYHLLTHLSVPDSDRWLSGTGSYDDIHDGDVVCEGIFHYDTEVDAQADLGAFEGMSPTVTGSQPAGWANCGAGGYSTCPEGDVSVHWGTPHYGDPTSQSGDRTYESSLYGYRSIDYQEVAGSTVYSNKVSDVATVLSGVATLAYGRTGSMVYHLLHAFDPLSGTQPSYSGSFTVSLPAGGSGDYGFEQGLDVDAGTIVSYNVHDDNERYWSYDSLGGGQSTYTRSNIEGSAEITIVAEEDVGVVPPEIMYVDVGSDGFIIGEDSFSVSPGESVPVTIRMHVPDRPDGFYALDFEFYDVGVEGMDGISFTPTSMPADCSDCSIVGCGQVNGGHLLGGAYNVDIEGTLNFPENLPEGSQEISFSVSWRTCSGEEDCNGEGRDEETPYIPVEFDFPEGELPDLICSIEPVEYINNEEPGPAGFYPGQGVNDWVVRITNIGEANATINDTNYLCSAIMFNAYSSDLSPAFEPYTAKPIFPGTYYGTLEPGESTAVSFRDAPAVCTGEGDSIGALAWVNMLSEFFPECAPYMLEEVTDTNNGCTWTAPCIDEPAPGECQIIPQHVTNPPQNSLENFTLLCDGGSCSGTVAWETTETGADVGELAGSDQSGAQVQISDYPEEAEGEMLLEATVGYPDNMVCNATIEISPDGGGDDGFSCFVVPTPQSGYPGSEHDFEVYCDPGGEEEPEYCSADWAITHGNDYVGDFNPGSWWASVKIKEDLMLGEEDEVVVRASVEDVVCSGRIILPSMDCYDFI